MAKKTQSKKKAKKNFNVFHLLGIFVIGILVGQIINTELHNKHGHKDEVGHSENSHHEHHHEKYEYNNPQNPLSLDLKIFEDSKKGYNLQLSTGYFIFDPFDVGKIHLDGYGHAHLYINGEKVTRIYSPWHYIPSLPKGENEIRVTLNTNDHKDYTVNGEVIEDTITVIVE